MKKILIFLFGISLVMPMTAESRSISEDVQCILLSNVFASAAKNDQQKWAASAVGLFYLGRIDGKIDEKSLQKTAREQLAALDKNKTDVKRLMSSCATRMEQSGKFLQTTLGALSTKK